MASGSGGTPPQTSQQQPPASVCCDEMEIPPLLPGILKTFTKCAITTQPRDLLQWSAAYFRSLDNGQVPPCKDRLEYLAKEAPSGLTKGLLRILHKQMGRGQKRTNLAVLKPKWTDICLDPAAAENLLQSNGISPDDFDWNQFVAAAASSISNSGFHEIMFTVCDVLGEVSSRPGYEPRIPVNDFIEAYLFLAQRRQLDPTVIGATQTFLTERAKDLKNCLGAAILKEPESPMAQIN